MALPSRGDVWWCELTDMGRRSGVNLDSVENVSVAVLVERLGRLSGERMHQICGALAVAVDCDGG